MLTVAVSVRPVSGYFRRRRGAPDRLLAAAGCRLPGLGTSSATYTDDLEPLVPRLRAVNSPNDDTSRCVSTALASLRLVETARCGNREPQTAVAAAAEAQLRVGERNSRASVVSRGDDVPNRVPAVVLVGVL